MKRLSRILVTNLDIERDGDQGVRRSGPKKIHDDRLIFSKFVLAMRKEKAHARRPSPKNANPIGFRTEHPLQEGLILFDKRVARSKILRIIVVVVTLVHQRKQFLEVDVRIQKNLAPESLRERIRDRSELCFVDEDVLNVLGTED